MSHFEERLTQILYAGKKDSRVVIDDARSTRRSRDMPQFVIIEPKHSAKQNYVPVSNLR